MRDMVQNLLNHMKHHADDLADAVPHRIELRPGPPQSLLIEMRADTRHESCARFSAWWETLFDDYALNLDTTLSVTMDGTSLILQGTGAIWNSVPTRVCTTIPHSRSLFPNLYPGQGMQPGSTVLDGLALEQPERPDIEDHDDDPDEGTDGEDA